jgi:hypothetical protein
MRVSAAHSPSLAGHSAIDPGLYGKCAVAAVDSNGTKSTQRIQSTQQRGLDRALSGLFRLNHGKIVLGNPTPSTRGSFELGVNV